MEKAKILCICALPPPYHGVSVANEILLNSPKLKDKYDLIIITMNKPKLKLGGEISLNALVGDLFITYKLLKAIVTYKPDITYFCLGQNRLALLRDACWIWLTTIVRSKCLVHLHGANFRHVFDTNIGKLVQAFLRVTFIRLRGVIVLDQTLESLFHGLVPEERLFVLQNGIPDLILRDRFAEILQQRQAKTKLQVTYLSNFIPGKGYDLFLETATLLKQRGMGQGFCFNLAGATTNPEIAAEVNDRAAYLGDTVNLWGEVQGERKVQMLLESDVFVLPTSLAEGQPISIIEALSAGLPVIATARGGIPALVQDGVNGFLLEKPDPAIIAEKLLALRAQVPLRLAMSRASRALYEEKFTQEKFIHGFIDIIDKIRTGNH